jgi:DNA-binding MarR family transcriptional regulator
MAKALRSRAGVDVERETFIAIMRAHARLVGEMEALLAEYGLSEPQFNALRIVRGAGSKGLPTQQIAERLISRQPDVTRLIDRLCEAGLVARRRCEEDRRVVYVVLTAAGRKKLAALDGPVDALHGAQFAHMPRRRVVLLGELLSEVCGRE